MELCPWESAKYFVYSSNIPTLFFYSHIPAILAALFAGFFVFYKTKKTKIGATLLAISILFSLWCVFDIFIWATNRPDVVLFFWSLQILFEPLVYLLCFYLIYLFTKEHDLDFKWKLLWILFYSPVLLLLPTKYNLAGVYVDYCNAVEGFIAQYYTYAVESAAILAIIVFVVFHKTAGKTRREVIVFSLGIILFLAAFSSGNIIGSFTENWTLAQAGLIGMPIFVAFLAYMIVRFKTFNIKLIATQALVAAIGFSILGILFIRRIESVRIVTALTLILVTIAGDRLISSVTREVKQREELARLNADLETVIKQRESLVHLVTHKVKGSFTRSKYIFAEMLDGTFGAMSPALAKMAGEGLESDNAGIATVDLVLNAANLGKGEVKYDMKKLDFKEIVAGVAAEKKIPAEKKNLQMAASLPAEPLFVSGDAIWLKEVVNNLIENSIRYTKEGKIALGLARAGDSAQLVVEDTGIGITPADQKNLFREGGRGKDSVKMNVDSTGYGLYSVKLILDAHKGKIWFEPRPGGGSKFFVTLPLI